MSFPRYRHYKDSGVEWLGEVPEHWEVVPLRWVARCCSGDGISSEDVEPVQETGHAVGAIGGNGLMGYTATGNIDHPVLAIGRVGALCGNIHLIEPPAWVTDNALILDAHSDVFDLRFLAFALRRRNLNEIASKTAQPLITGTQVGDQRIPAPPLPEQEAIVMFLGHEIGRIDELVAEQRRLMELLKEKRQAVISHAVTKGLNPRAPMKPSGIEWLGDVPEHWEVKPLKYLMSLTSGGTPNKENLAYWDGNIPWASSKDLKSDELFDTKDHITQKALDDGAAELVPPGSILTVVRGMILLHTFPVVVARVPMAINQDLKAILPTAGIDADFLAWLLRGASDEVLSRTDEAGHGTKVLRMESWLAMPTPVPPLKEQILITANIIKRLGELDALAAEAQKAIDLLQERRTALISAAVTGQIDVRKIAAA